jgi:hypothetical protein
MNDKNQIKFLEEPLAGNILRTDKSFTMGVYANAAVNGGQRHVGTTFEFDIGDLAVGASLARLMTVQVRKYLLSGAGRDLSKEDAAAFKRAAHGYLPTLRNSIEGHFASVVLNAHGE